MSKTKISHGSNMMWGGSRFILPEHSNALNLHDREKQRKVRPVFDEQELEELNHRIHVAIHTQALAMVTVYGEFDFTEVTGIILTVDQYGNQLRMSSEEDLERIDLKVVVDLAI